MWEQIQSNRRKTAVLIVCMAALLFVLGYVIAEAVAPGAGIMGLAVAGGIWALLTLIAFAQGDNIVLALSGARERAGRTRRACSSAIALSSSVSAVR